MTPFPAPDATASPRPEVILRTPIRRRIAIAAGSVLALAAVLVALVGWLPVAMLRVPVEQRLGAVLGTPVSIGSLSRSPGFSFAPDITASDVRIAQPGWVPGGGDFVRLRSATVRVPLWSALVGRFRPNRLVVAGATVALYRSAAGRDNWKRDQAGGDSGSDDLPPFTDLTITDSALSIRDDKRRLMLAGPLALDAAHGLRWSARGAFHQTPATLDLTGGRVVGAAPGAPYPFVAHFASPALRLDATGVSDGVLNLRHFTATVAAQAPTLMNVDYAVEAGLFGSQPVDLHGVVRHDGHDWTLERIVGAVGRSRFVGRAALRRQGEGDSRRTVITAALHASRFDFDDLADTAGRARAAARRAEIGPRVLPPTPIDLTRLGRTDGVLAFRIDHVLSDAGTVFQTLQGDLSLDHRLLTLRNLVATFADGRLTGALTLDHRSGLPKLSTDLRVSGARLGALLGGSDLADAPLRGRIVLRGQGETVRAALSHADGKAALVATQGSIRRTVADVLGQDLSGTVAHAVVDPGARVPLRCLVADFRAVGGVLTPHPLAIDTGTSLGRGSGRIVLDGETIDLTLAGASKHSSLLRIADPIRVAGTLSAPAVSVADLPPNAKPGIGGFFKVFGRSIGQALGLTKSAPPAAAAPTSFDCAAAVAAALR